MSESRDFKKGDTAYVEGVPTPFLVVEDKFPGHVYAVHGVKYHGQPRVKITRDRLLSAPAESKPLSQRGEEPEADKDASQAWKEKPRIRKQTGYKVASPGQDNSTEEKPKDE